MSILPIVARELRVASRKRNTYLGRVVAAFVPITVAGFWVPVFAAQYNVSQGRMLFAALSVLLFGYCLLAGAQVTADCLSSEKREGTIGLLFLTDLQGYDIVLGKLVSSSLSAFYGLLATVPVLALAILLGGVTLVQLGLTALLFLNTLFFSLAAGVFVSAVSRDDRRAMFATVCVLLLVLFAPYGLGMLHARWLWARTGSGPAGWDELSVLVQFSPLFAFRVLHAKVATPGFMQAFSQSLLSTHLLGWGLLILASLIAPRVCRERARGKAGMRWMLFRNRWSYGSPARRAAFRKRLLDRNAFYWLAARDRIKAHYVWLFVGSLGWIWLGVGLMMGEFSLDWEILISLLFVCFVFLKVWLVSEVCTRLVEDRSCGAFELLLSSPLSVRDMARGQTLALRRQFGRPVIALLGLTFLLMFWAVRSPHYGRSNGEIRLLFWSLMIMLAADLVTLKWVAMWQGIRNSQINRATSATCARVLFLPTLMFVIVCVFWALTVQVIGSNPFGVVGTVCGLWLFIGLAADAFFGLRARWLFLHHLRDVAAQRFAGEQIKFQPFFEMLAALRDRLWRNRHRPGTAERQLPFWRRWWVAGPAVLLVCALAGALLWKRSVQRQVESRLAAIVAKGEPIDTAGLLRWRQAVLPQENAGLIYQKAGMRLISSRFDRGRPSRGAPLLDAPLDWISNAVARSGPALELLHSAAKLPKSQFPIDWSRQPSNVILWQAMHPLNQAPDLLEIEAAFWIEQGDPARAVQSIRSLLALARAMGQEPFLSAQTLRTRSLNTAVRALERLLNRHALADPDLANLQNDLLQADAATSKAVSRTFIGERALQLESFRSRDPSMGGPPGWGSTFEKTMADFREFIVDALEIRNRFLIEFLEIADDYVRRAAQAGAGDARALAGLAPPGPAGPALPGTQARYEPLKNYWNDVLRGQVATIARLRLAQAALAVERYRASNQGRRLETLEELTPEFRTSLPLDPFTQAPLEVRLLDGGYEVSSAGVGGGVNFDADPRWRVREESGLAFKVTR